MWWRVIVLFVVGRLRVFRYWEKFVIDYGLKGIVVGRLIFELIGGGLGLLIVVVIIGLWISLKN